MNSFIQAFVSELDTGRFKATMELIDKARSEGRIRTREEFDIELNNIVNQTGLKNWESVFKPLLPNLVHGVILSGDFNENFKGVYLDLNALFAHISKLGSTVDDHERIMTNELVKARDAVRKLLEDAAIFRYIKANPEWNEIKYNTFVDVRNRAITSNKAAIDRRTRTLSLPILNEQVLTDKKATGFTTITINNLSAGDAGRISRNFKPSNALDTLNDTFWGDVILADKPLTTVYESTEYKGVVTEAIIEFSHIEQFTKVEILPFGLFPVEIIDIRVSEDGVTYTQWAGFDIQDPTLDWLIYRAVATNTRFLKVAFLQKNYTKPHYMLPKDMVEITKVWEQILDNTTSNFAAVETLSPQDERARAVNKDFNALIDAQRSMDMELLAAGATNGSDIPEMSHAQRASTIENYMLDNPSGPQMGSAVVSVLPGNAQEVKDTSKFIEITKTEYVLGAYTIKVSNVIYTPGANYRSAKYATRGVPLAVRLETVETHEDDSDGRQVTGVEYSIELAENRSFPILPKDTTRVENEVVSLEAGNNQFETRFTPTATPAEVMYLNNRLLVSGVDYTMSGSTVTLVGFELEMNLGLQLVLSYTVDQYTSYDIDSNFLPIRLKKPLEFKGTNDRGVIELPFCPYVNRGIITAELYDSPIWSRTNKEEGLWYLRRDAGPQKVEGYWYGSARAFVKTISSGFQLSLEETAGGTQQEPEWFGFPSVSDGEYIVSLDDSLAYATTSDAASPGRVIIDSTRTGLEGTSIFESGDTSLTVALHALSYYEPILVEINGIKANNITDYLEEEQPGFARVSNSDVQYQYIQLGRKLYFNKPLTGVAISVTYMYKAKYMQLVAELNSAGTGRAQVTPVVCSYRLALQTAKR